jgi:hypothetical protein
MARRRSHRHPRRRPAAAVTREHTFVTATRALSPAVDVAGRVDGLGLEFVAQRAVDDVLRKVEAVGGRFDPAGLVVDVRATAFLPGEAS